MVTVHAPPRLGELAHLLRSRPLEAILPASDFMLISAPGLTDYPIARRFCLHLAAPIQVLIVPGSVMFQCSIPGRFRLDRGHEIYLSLLCLGLSHRLAGLVVRLDDLIEDRVGQLHCAGECPAAERQLLIGRAWILLTQDFLIGHAPR